MTKRALGSLLHLIPLLLATTVMPPFPWMLAASVALLWIPMERAGLRVTGIVLTALQDVMLRHGERAGMIASLACVVTAGALLLCARRAKGGDFYHALGWLYPPVSVAAAVVMTFYQGGGYFAVGAQGAGLTALIRSYRMLGFHPNWRTVLFSTIMMVVLITWPRKFKTLSKTLPGGFVGVVVVTALNCLLYADPVRSTVAELPLALPFLRRCPISALSMLLIFIAWEEVPWARVNAIFTAIRRRCQFRAA